ncbi:MAG: hypothetical protein IJX17_04515 [Clostridia bacterium]|nr:hypothetical protein [Clostridia bacterium]
MLFVFSKLKLRKWKKLSPDKRYNVLMAIEKKVASWLGIKPLKLEIKVDGDHWNCFGAFTTNGGTQKIIINENLLHEQRYRFHALETIAHETRHAYQYSLISRDLKWYEFTAKKWKRNWFGYFSSSTDNLMYNNQSVERDAQKYSLKILKKYRGKYNGEKDYRDTYDAVLYRYEQADINARKEYGIFYKQKIERNIKKNSKNKGY